MGVRGRAAAAPLANHVRPGRVLPEGDDSCHEFQILPHSPSHADSPLTGQLLALQNVNKLSFVRLSGALVRAIILWCLFLETGDM